MILYRKQIRAEALVMCLRAMQLLPSPLPSLSPHVQQLADQKMTWRRGDVLRFGGGEGGGGGGGGGGRLLRKL